MADAGPAGTGYRGRATVDSKSTHTARAAISQGPQPQHRGRKGWADGGHVYGCRRLR